MSRFIPIFIIILIGCTPTEKVETSENPKNLIGTWERVRYVDTQVSDSAWMDQDPGNIYLKHITPTHFTWLSFNTTTQTLNGTGGGTYTYDGETYSEDINYFYPAGSSIVGKTIPFTVDFRDSLWHHVGFYQATEIDPELDEIDMSDTIRIEELWKPVTTDRAYPQLVGTWELVSMKSRNDSTRVELPPFMRFYKLLTPTHFNWVQINMDDYQVYAEGGGTFTLSDDEYIEHPEYHFPIQEALRGLTIPFHFELDSSGYWIHKGMFTKPLLDSAGIEIGIDTIYIDEVWKRWAPETQ